MADLSEGDRRHARVALERGWLSIDDVAACREAMEKTGLPFIDVARAKGLLTPDRLREIALPPAPAGRPPRRIPVFYVALLILAGLMLLGSEVFFRVRMARVEERHEQQTAEARRRADEEARAEEERQRRLFRERNREQAAQWLRQGRYILLRAEEVLARNPRENLDASLKEATGYYCLYLDVFPDDADALFERAQVHLYRNAIPEAERDLEAACKSDPARDASFRAKFRDLRARLGR